MSSRVESSLALDSVGFEAIMGLENLSGFFRMPSSFRRSPALGRRAVFLYRWCRQEKGHDIMANDLIDLIKTRRSVRLYTEEPVSEELLEQVLEAGTFAPTGGGHQSPVIVAVTDPETRERLRQLNAAVMGRDADPYTMVPLSSWLCSPTAGAAPLWKTVPACWRTLCSQRTPWGSPAAGSTASARSSTALRARRSSGSGACPRHCAAWVPSPWDMLRSPRARPPRARTVMLCASSRHWSCQRCLFFWGGESTRKLSTENHC